MNLVKVKRVRDGEVFGFGKNLWIKLAEEDGRVVAISQRDLKEEAFDHNSVKEWNIKGLKQWRWEKVPYGCGNQHTTFIRCEDSTAALYFKATQGGNGRIRPICNLSPETIVNAKRSSLEEIIEDTKEWLQRNWGSILDTVYETALECYEENGIKDEADIDQMTEEVSEKLKEAIFNILDTYEHFDLLKESRGEDGIQDSN